MYNEELNSSLLLARTEIESTLYIKVIMTINQSLNPFSKSDGKEITHYINPHADQDEFCTLIM